MRFMAMHKVDRSMESGAPPSQEVIAGMGRLIEEGLRTGVFRAGEGLRPSSTRTRLTVSGGEVAVQHGPYGGSNELVAGFALIKVRSRDEAIEWAKRFARVVGDVELEVGPVTEPWDLGFGPKPAGDVPLRFLVLAKADARSEAGLPPTAKEQAEMGKLVQEMTRAGVLLATEGLLPSSKGVRLRYRAGKRTVIDGPFAESKELIAGFSIVEVRSREEAIAWTDRFAAVLGDVEVDLLQLHPEPASDAAHRTGVAGSPPLG